MDVDMDDQQGESKKEDGVLIEKDGRFELVSVSDVQAEENLQQHQKTNHELVQDQHQPSNASDNHHSEQEAVSNKDVNTPEGDSIPSQAHTESGIKSESTVSFAVGEGKLSPQKNTLNVASSASLAHNSKHRQLVMRTKSAPGVREGRQLNEEDALKRERNEAAFRAWLAKKNKEITEQRQTELSKVRKTEEELREKQRRNELAYQAWLECKKQEYLEQKAKERAIRPVTSITRDEEARRRAAFENWLLRKQEQKQKENDSKQRVREQEEVAAKKADPAIVTQAYKRFVVSLLYYCMVLLILMLNTL